MKLIRAKRLLTDKELDELNNLTPVKQKKYLELKNKELFEEYEFTSRR